MDRFRSARLFSHVALAFALGASGCDRPSPGGPTTPSATPSPAPAPPGPRPPFTLSGTVYEFTAAGQRPLPGAPLDISAEYQSHTPQATSDDAGHYSVTTTLSEIKVAAEVRGYSQPCRAGARLSGDSVLDVHVVADDLLARSGIPSTMPVLEPSISGEVFEMTVEGRQPIPGARVTVDFSGGFGWAPSATTITDISGRFLLCGVVNVGWGLAILASKTGYVYSYRSIDPNASRTYDLQLSRQ